MSDMKRIAGDADVRGMDSTLLVLAGLILVIGLIMVFGFSLDYGIFAANLYTGRLDRPMGPGVWTSVLLAATVTMIGFGPLILCRHPVLAHLGQVLFWGTAGTVLGCIWGIPGIYWRPRRVSA